MNPPPFFRRAWEAVREGFPAGPKNVVRYFRWHPLVLAAMERKRRKLERSSAQAAASRSGPRRVLVNYADGWPRFKVAQLRNAETALRHNVVDQVRLFNRSHIDPAFYERNKRILDQPAGGGYWLWKPYFVQRALAEVRPGDFVFYSDARVLFIRPPDGFYELNQSQAHGITAFRLRYRETQYTKRSAFRRLGCDEPRYYTGTNEVQNLASFFLLRKTDFSVEFVRQWLEYAQDYETISDSPSDDNFPDFVAHRHDQSIWSLLLKKHGIETYVNPSQHGNAARPADYFYGQFINHTRGHGGL